MQKYCIVKHITHMLTIKYDAIFFSIIFFKLLKLIKKHKVTGNGKILMQPDETQMILDIEG